MGMVVFNPLGEKVMDEGLFLQEVYSNNEVEYSTLCHGLEWCVSNGIDCLDIYGDFMLIVKQVQEI